jgi:hypothetical protein
MTEFTGQERRSHVALSDEQIEIIAERAAEKAIEKMTANLYQEIGKGFINKALTLIGVLTVALAIWATQKGIVKF